MPEFDLEVLAFKTPKAFATFLAKNHARQHGIWLRFFNKGSGVKTITYAEALDEALCYGWIDGHIKKYDDTSHVRRFTPRRPRSIWSKINKGHIARLINEGRMKPPGMKQVELAQSDGRWEAAYDSSRTITLPEEFVAALVIYHPKPASDYQLKTGHIEEAMVRRIGSSALEREDDHGEPTRDGGAAGNSGFGPARLVAATHRARAGGASRDGVSLCKTGSR